MKKTQFLQLSLEKRLAGVIYTRVQPRLMSLLNPRIEVSLFRKPLSLISKTSMDSDQIFRLTFKNVIVHLRQWKDPLLKNVQFMLGMIIKSLHSLDLRGSEEATATSRRLVLMKSTPRQPRKLRGLQQQSSITTTNQLAATESSNT